jgi:hypothetical protein
MATPTPTPALTLGDRLRQRQKLRQQQKNGLKITFKKDSKLKVVRKSDQFNQTDQGGQVKRQKLLERPPAAVEKFVEIVEPTRISDYLDDELLVENQLYYRLKEAKVMVPNLRLRHRGTLPSKYLASRAAAFKSNINYCRTIKQTRYASMDEKEQEKLVASILASTGTGAELDDLIVNKRAVDHWDLTFEWHCPVTSDTDAAVAASRHPPGVGVSLIDTWSLLANDMFEFVNYFCEEKLEYKQKKQWVKYYGDQHREYMAKKQLMAEMTAWEEEGGVVIKTKETKEASETADGTGPARQRVRYVWNEKSDFAPGGTVCKLIDRRLNPFTCNLIREEIEIAELMVEYNKMEAKYEEMRHATELAAQRDREARKVKREEYAAKKAARNSFQSGASSTSMPAVPSTYW